MSKKGKLLDIIYENEAPTSVPATSKNGHYNDFKENMLLSFYNWPKVETSAVFKECIKNTIQSENSALERYQIANEKR